MKITILILFSLFLGSEALGQQPGSNPKRLLFMPLHLTGDAGLGCCQPKLVQARS